MTGVNRLWEWMIAPLLFFWLLSLGTAYLAAISTVNIASDVQLASIAEAIAEDYAGLTATDPALKQSSWTTRWVRAELDKGLRYAILDQRISLLAGDLDLQEAAAASLFNMLPEGAVASGERAGAGTDVLVNDELHRLWQVAGQREGRRFIVVVAQNKTHHEPLVREVMIREAVPLSAILILATGLVIYGIAYVGRPMSQLQRQLSQRGSQNLAPIDLRDVPQELEPLLGAINTLMQRLDQSIASQRRFIADAAHQLRTPIAALQAQAELVQELPAGEQRDAALQRMRRTIQRTGRLSTQLLSLARAESSLALADRQSIDLVALCREVAIDVSETALAKNIEFAFEADDEPFFVSGDPTLLGEALRNLLDNAFKFTPHDGQVTLRCLSALRVVKVEDSGPGVPADQVSRVFNAFARVSVRDPQTGQGVPGTGLGLTIVHEVALVHDASVNLGPSLLGGACFELVFCKQTAS